MAEDYSQNVGPLGLNYNIWNVKQNVNMSEIKNNEKNLKSFTIISHNTFRIVMNRLIVVEKQTHTQYCT